MKSPRKNPPRTAPEPLAPPAPAPGPPPKTAPIMNLMVRLTWLLYGNAALGICWFSIAGRGERTIGSADFVYIAAVLIMIAARYFDVKVLNGLTSEGQPATMAHFKSYAITLCAVAAGLYLAAQFIAAYKWL